MQSPLRTDAPRRTLAARSVLFPRASSRLRVYRRAYDDPDATLDDLREAVSTLEEIERTARRVMGGAHPLTEGMEDDLQHARALLRARETALAEALAGMRVADDEG